MKRKLPRMLLNRRLVLHKKQRNGRTKRLKQQHNVLSCQAHLQQVQFLIVNI
jgi:hypothetical protein